MQIDYFTTIAQIINFLILVYLLRRFLYRPILKSMDEREQKIISRLKEAEQKKKDAEQEVESYRKMLQELSDKRQDMNAKAAKEAQILQDRFDRRRCVARLRRAESTGTRLFSARRSRCSQT